MNSFKLTLENYKAPTPAFWRKIGDSLLSIASVTAMGGLWQFDSLKDILTPVEIKAIIGISIGVGVIGKFLTNFFKEEEIKIQA